MQNFLILLLQAEDRQQRKPEFDRIETGALNVFGKFDHERATDRKSERNDVSKYSL
jgi:hypothetical protein